MRGQVTFGCSICDASTVYLAGFGLTVHEAAVDLSRHGWTAVGDGTVLRLYCPTCSRELLPPLPPEG